MLNDPMIFYLSIVLLILVSIALYQQLYSLTGFLIVTYFMYIGIIYFSGIQRGEKNPSIDTPTKISGKVQIDRANEVRIDSAETLEDITVTTDSIPSEQLSLNYIMVARDVDIKNRNAINPGSVFPDSVGTLCCLSGIDNRNGGIQEILHKWMYMGKTIAKVKMVVERSINWRCWSVVKIDPKRAGKWEIILSDTNEIEFASTTFRIIKSE
jgi:hypothetical protein